MDSAALGLSPDYKFEPTDEELVACYLLPALRGQPVPCDGAIILHDDPRSTPPWQLLRRHGRAGEAFFFAPGEAKYRKGHQNDRGCAGGGTWRRQKSVDGEPLRVNGGGPEIGWRKCMLNFHLAGGKGSTGWVTHEYSVTAPADLAASALRLCRVRLGGHKGMLQDCQEDGLPYVPPPGAGHVEGDHCHSTADGECSAMPETSTPDQEPNTMAQWSEGPELIMPEGWLDQDSFEYFAVPD